jgi:hypothetical protein
MAQLLQMNRTRRSLLDACTFVMQHSSHGQSTATHNELADLILTHMRNCPLTYIVLDGIDEAEDDAEIIRSLQCLASAQSCRLLLFSRPTIAPLQRAGPREMQFEISKASIEGDIKLYFRNETDELVEDGLLPDDVDVVELTNQLTTGADGMFLWARLMISYLSSPVFEPFHRLQIIQSVTFPEGLDSMYNRIFSLILRRSDRERDLASRILLWLTYSLTHLDTSQLREAVKQGNPQNHDAFEAMVIWACAGLVDRFREGTVNERPFRGFRLIHLSVKEYLSKDTVGNSWTQRSYAPIRQIIPVASIAHLEIARTCLHYLTFYTPAQPFSGDAAKGTSPVVFHQGFPFASYAAPFWVRHLQASLDDPGKLTDEVESNLGATLTALTKSLQSFLEKPLIVLKWIEAHYLAVKLLLAENPSAEVLDLCPKTGALSGWARWLACNYHSKRRRISTSNRPESESFGEIGELCNNLSEFEGDMQELQLHWSANLLQTPEIIWDEVTAFTSSKFLFKAGNTKVTSLAAGNPQSSSSSKNPLCTISDAATDGKLMAVLSIWPSTYLSS